MTRSELITRLAAHSHFAQLTANDDELSVKAILEGMSEALVSGGRIEIHGWLVGVKALRRTGCAHGFVL